MSPPASILVVLAAACSGQNEKSSAEPSAEPAPEEASPVQTASPYDALPPAMRLAMDNPFTGDLDETGESVA